MNKNLIENKKHHWLENFVNFLAIFSGTCSIFFGVLNLFSVVFFSFWCFIGGIMQIATGITVLIFDTPKFFYCCYDEDLNDVLKSYKNRAILYCVIAFVPALLNACFISLIIGGLIFYTGITYAIMARFLKPKANVNLTRNLAAQTPVINQQNDSRKPTTLTNTNDSIIPIVDSLLDSTDNERNSRYTTLAVDALPMVHGKRLINTKSGYNNNGYYVDHYNANHHYNNISHGHQNIHDEKSTGNAVHIANDNSADNTTSFVTCNSAASDTSCTFDTSTSGRCD